MKILLVRPPAKYCKGSAKPSASIPLGLLYIAAVLEKNGYSVEIYDAQINPKRPIFSEPDGSVHMGDSWETVEEEITRRSPDIVGITNLFSAQFDNAAKAADIVKKVNNNTLVVVGGNHPTVQPEDFFTKTESVDLVCIGEGEYTTLDIVRAFKEKGDLKNISGTAVKQNDGVKLNLCRSYINDLDSLPYPAYHLINLEDYFLLSKKGFNGRPVWRYPGSEREISLITSRGCPFNCIFCSIHLHMGNNWRYHSAGYVQKHLNLLVAKYKIKHVHFEDDNLTLNSQRFEEILRGLIAAGVNLTWDTPNGVRADTLTPELLEKMKESGCTYIILGIESGRQKVLSEIIRKNLDLEKLVTTARWCKEARLDTMSFFVIGFPGEKLSDMQETVDFSLRLMRDYDITPTVFIATPLLGTELYETCKKSGYLRKELSPAVLAAATGGTGEDSLIETPDFGPRQISMIMQKFIAGFKKIFLRNLAIFFLKNPFLCFKFTGMAVQLTPSLGFKGAVLELASLKHCLKRR